MSDLASHITFGNIGCRSLMRSRAGHSKPATAAHGEFDDIPQM